MAALSIRDLDDGVKERLRVRAARNGRSMEAEARSILTEAVDGPRAERNLVTALMDAAAEAGGVELELPSRDWSRPAPDFSQ